MNKAPKLIAVFVVIFIFGIQLLVFESYQTSVFINNNDDDDNNNNNKNDDNNKKEDDDDDNDDDNVMKFKAKVCEKLLDSETCKKIEEELKSTTRKLNKEEIRAEEITNKYLEPIDPNKNTINNLQQTNENTQIGNPEPIQNEIVKSDANSQNLSSPPPTPPINTSDSSTISLSLANLNTLDQNQLIDAISAKLSQLRNFEKNKISQVLIDLTQSTAAKGGDVMNSLRQIGTKILQNPSDPLVDKIVALAQKK
jgi:hypothetical protein